VHIDANSLDLHPMAPERRESLGAIFYQSSASPRIIIGLTGVAPGPIGKPIDF
jgi:hypothetical protein